MLVSAVNKNTLEVIRYAAKNKLSDEWIVVSDEFIDSVPKKYWVVENGALSEISDKGPIDLEDARRIKLSMIDGWLYNKAEGGIQIEEGIILPSNTDNAVQLQVYLGTLQPNEPVIVTDINNNPHLLNPAKILEYITVYTTEFKTRRATWYTIKSQINAAVSINELNSIVIPE